MQLFVNGVEIFSGAAGNPIYYNGVNDDLPPHPLGIGVALEMNAPASLNGQVDEVSVYGRALTQPEIFEIVKRGSFGKCASSALRFRTGGSRLVLQRRTERARFALEQSWHATKRRHVCRRKGRAGFQP